MSDPEEMDGLDNSTRHLVITRRGISELEVDATGWVSWELVGVAWLLGRLADQLQDVEDEEAENDG